MSALNLAIKNARERAREVLEQYPESIQNGHVSVEKLLEKVGIKIKKEAFEDQRVSGFIQMKTNAGSPIIVINDNNTSVRQRFTIAHELGHYFLHSAQSVHVDDIDTADMVLYRDEVASQATHLREIEANQFAAELLMPDSLISKDIEKLRKENNGMSDIIVGLAEKYEVSQAAMAIRLNKIF